MMDQRRLFYFCLCAAPFWLFQAVCLAALGKWDPEFVMSLLRQPAQAGFVAAGAIIAWSRLRPAAQGRIRLLWPSIALLGPLAVDLALALALALGYKR
jgi:hypothetical protein